MRAAFSFSVPLSLRSGGRCRALLHFLLTLLHQRCQPGALFGREQVVDPGAQVGLAQDLVVRRAGLGRGKVVGRALELAGARRGLVERHAFLAQCLHFRARLLEVLLHQLARAGPLRVRQPEFVEQVGLPLLVRAWRGRWSRCLLWRCGEGKGGAGEHGGEQR